MIIDSQTHLWEAERPDRRWEPGRQAGLPQPFTAEDFLPMMDEAGVDRAVIVPPGMLARATANLYALECVARFPGRFGVVGLVDLHAPDVADQIAALRRTPGILGVRAHLTDADQCAWPRPNALDPLLTACQAERLPVALFVPRNTPAAITVAERFPDLTILVDHLGLPFIDDGQHYPQFDATLALARFPNVALKLSSLPARSREPFPFADMHGVVERVYQAFGPERLLWGSDFTQHLARRPARYVDEVRWIDALPFLSDADRALIRGDNLARILAWEE